MQDFSRRGFLGAAAAAVTTARTYSQVARANDRLRIGVIGCGGQAMGHMRTLLRMKDGDNAEVSAVCDVYQKRLDQAAQLTGGKPYRRYQDLLADKSLDYVLIATPEHWHAQMTLDAIDAGKHIYCEKPMTRSIEQSKRVVARLKNAKVKMQVGVQGMSDDSYITARRYVKEGALGKVVLAQIDYSRNHTGDFFQSKQDSEARPGENLDWEAFLGPAPKRKWDPDRFFSWRRYWDYSGGVSGDLFVHRITRLVRALDLSFPDRGAAAGGKFQFGDSSAEIPDTITALLDYPEGLTMQLISSQANDTRVEHMLRGHKATLQFTPTGFVIKPQRLFAAEAKEIVHQKSGAESLELHHRNLMNAIRKNEALNCDVMLGYYGVVASEMVNQSYRRRKYLKWDRKRERLVTA